MRDQCRVTSEEYLGCEDCRRRHCECKGPKGFIKMVWIARFQLVPIHNNAKE